MKELKVTAEGTTVIIKPVGYEDCPERKVECASLEACFCEALKARNAVEFWNDESLGDFNAKYGAVMLLLREPDKLHQRTQHLDRELRMRLVEAAITAYDHLPEQAPLGHIRLRLLRLNLWQEIFQDDIRDDIRDIAEQRLDHYAEGTAVAAIERLPYLDGDKQTKISADVEKWYLDEIGRKVSQYQKLSAVRRRWQERFIEKWALSTRLDLLLAQSAEIAAAARGWRTFLSVTQRLAWGLLVLFWVGALLALIPALAPYWQRAATLPVFASLGAAFFALMILWPKAGRAWAPRLGAVSAIGYLAVSSLDPLRRMNEPGASWLLAVGLPLICVLMSFAYLHFGETHKKIRDQRLAAKRAVVLLGSGLGQAWAIGALGHVLMGAYVPPGAAPIYWNWGPIALLTGLIAQSLWETDTITEPI